MNKLLTIGLTALGTVGVATGTVAVLDNIPATKDKLHISINNTDIVGNKVEQEKKNKEELEKIVQQLNNLKAENAEIKEELIQEQVSVQMLENQKTELESTISQNEEEIATLTTSNTNLQSQVTTLTSEVEAKTSHVSDLEDQVKANNTLIAELEATCEENTEEIARLNSENSTLNNQITALNLDIETKNSEISTLNATINSQSSQITTLEIQNEEYSATISSLNTQITEKNANLSELETSLSTSNATIIELQSKVDKYTSVLENYVLIDYVVYNKETTKLQDKFTGIDFESPVKDGFTFKGWSFTDGGEIISDDYVFVEDTSIYAVFELNSIPLTVGSVEYDSANSVALTSSISIAQNEDGLYYIQGSRHALLSTEYGFFTSKDSYDFGPASKIFSDTYLLPVQDSQGKRHLMCIKVISSSEVGCCLYEFVNDYFVSPYTFYASRYSSNGLVIGTGTYDVLSLNEGSYVLDHFCSVNSLLGNISCSSGSFKLICYDNSYTVKFKLENGVINESTLTSGFMLIDLNIDGRVQKHIIEIGDEMKYVPYKKGYIFKGWSLSKNGEVIDGNIIIDEKVTLYAIFEDESTIITEQWNLKDSLDFSAFIGGESIRINCDSMYVYNLPSKLLNYNGVDYSALNINSNGITLYTSDYSILKIYDKNSGWLVDSREFKFYNPVDQSSLLGQWLLANKVNVE